MSERIKIEKTFSQVKAPDDTLQRVYDKMEEKNKKRFRISGARAIVIVMVVVLSCMGAFAAEKFGISSHLFPSSSDISQEKENVVDSQNDERSEDILISVPFGDREAADGFKTHHDGIDFAAPTGTPVLAAAEGTVLEADFNESDGNYVKIEHHSGYVTVYKCLDSYSVVKGDVISQGDVIGIVGSTGKSTGPHLHFELQKDGTPVDPAQFFTK